ncbi:hypothetical protein PgNI_06223 [Pyricularia grisea]|uniref:Zn(2)-C6 fungal-type domain-containing protein n=1 Tax=Pyricularia grisea TaxID=148305 RepID=A0A6P8B588_PYRGI|nr:hypothetical protein PgNI_06223 [Pyricularia grisea]TLD10428.1 hypothetical protein PgNI_06223 [Pyricularia grisea]
MDHGPDPKRPRLGQEPNSSWSSARPAYPSYTTLPRLPEQASGQPHQHQHQHQQHQHQHPPHNHYPRSTDSPALPPLLTSPYNNNRSHEADPYPSRPSQPPQSPAHPPYQPAYSPRESPGGGGGGGVKRDPEEHLPHPNNRRQNSTGNAPEPHPVTPHGLPAHGMQAQSPAPPPPSQHPQPPHRPQHQQPLPQQPPPMDDRRQPSFDNGQSGPVFRQQQSYAPPPPPPPPPQTHNHAHIQSPYEQSPTHNMYSTPYQSNQEYSPYGSTSSVTTGKQRPKHQRASQACDRCRHLKAKCDEQKPCKNCKEKNEPCNYKEPIVKQQDKVQTELLEAVTSMSTSFADIKSLISGVDSRLSTRLTNLEEAMRTIVAAIRPGAVQPFPLSVKRELSGSEDTASNGPHESPNSGRGEPIGSPQVPLLGPMDKQQATEEAAHSATAEELIISKEAEEPIAPVILDDDRPDIPPGSPVPAGKPAIPENHTTGTGNLLMWPAIQNLVGHLLVENGIKYPKTYPLTIEENRGLLHLYGRGEGSKKRPGGREVPNDFGLLTSAYPEDVAPSPSSNNDWGCMDAMETAPFSPQNLPPTPETKTPSRKTVGGLRFDHDHVWKLVDSYKENMQNMHPIILPKDLDALIKNFLDSLPTVYVTKSVRPPPIAGFAAKHEIVGEKRKREDTDDGSEPKVAPQKRPAPSRHISTAVVLCILALGEICLHKDRIPDVVPTHGEMQSQGSFSSQPYGSQGSPASRNGVPPSPIQGTPPSVTSHPTGSRRASFQGSAGSTSGPIRRNMDVIPGLQYLANATDILGNQMGGTSVWHVYANILAGLYYGQLGRVMESYWHIHHACVKAQHLLRNHFSRLTCAKGQTQDIKDTRYYLIYWTCMQLESDIIAELNLQQSGISNYEQSMPHPNLEHMIECGIDQRVAYSYYGQLWLRKTLNKAHTMLYGPKAERDKYTLITLVKIMHSNLTDSEDLWWPKFHDHDPPTPADNILDARLRAKYWGAMNIICRPVIKSILMLDYQGMQESLDPTDPLNQLLDPNDKTVLEIAEKGINALLHSTKAFHNLAERRYIVTNIFGTAQAQWGNLITLAAVYRNQHLSHFIDAGELKYLFDKMIQFLEVISHRSSALEVDGKILVGLRDSLFPPGFSRPETHSATSSSAPQSTSIHTSMATQHAFQPLPMSPVHTSPIVPQFGPHPMPPNGLPSFSYPSHPPQLHPPQLHPHPHPPQPSHQTQNGVMDVQVPR